MNDEIPQRTTHLSKDQLKALRAPLIEAVEYAAEIGLEKDAFLEEVKGIWQSFNEADEEEFGELDEGA